MKQVKVSDSLALLWNHPMRGEENIPPERLKRVTRRASVWIDQGVDPRFLEALAGYLLLKRSLRTEKELGSRLRTQKERISHYLQKAREMVQKIDRLPNRSDEQLREWIDSCCKAIDHAASHLLFMGADPMPRGRLGERHITDFICLLSERLRALPGGGPQWRKIAEFLNDLLDRKEDSELTAVQVKSRCGRVTPVQQQACQKDFAEFQAVWEDFWDAWR